MPAPGFAAFGSFLGSDPDLQIYRKFNDLASRNLACMQSQLMALHTEIERLDELDRHDAETRPDGWMERQRPARSWEVLESKAAEGDEREKKRMDLILRLRNLMSEYQEALIKQSQVLVLDPPTSRATEALSAWYKHNRPLIGHSYDLYNQKHDLVALRTPPDQDRLTTFLQSNLGYYFRTKSQNTAEQEVTYFPEQTIRHIVAFLSVMLSAVLLIGAIVALFFAPNRKTKLGLIAVFTLAFAASVGILTNARKAEIYASTAAYAAVLVVYVSNDQDVHGHD